MKQSVLCGSCRFLHKGLPWKCDAYPEGIPDRFAFGRDLHIEPAEGDHGIQFELAEDLPEASRRIALKLIEAARAKTTVPAKSSS